MKNLYTLLVLILFSTVGFGQHLCESACTHDHDHEQCAVHMDEAEISWLIKEHQANVKQDNLIMRKGAATPRPFRIFLPYDQRLLIEHGGTYTHNQVVSMTTENALRFERGLNNSMIDNRGIFLHIVPWEFPDYETIQEYRAVASTIDDGILDDLYVMKNERLDMDHLILLTLQDVDGRGVNLQATEAVAEAAPSLFWTRNIGVVNFREIENGSITLAHEIGHGLSADHEEGFNTSISKPYARAYASPTANSIVKANSTLTEATEGFTGPNTYAVNYLGETIHMYVDSLTNNALAVETMLGHYWMNNVLLDATITGDVDCGLGTLTAESDNATEFIWSIVSGEVVLEGSSGKDVGYTAYSESVIMLLAGSEEKDYADTSFIDLPAVDVVAVDTVMTEGSTLPNGEIITSPGTYDVIIEPSNSGDCAYIQRYEVSFATNTSELFQSEIILSPNPVSDILYIDTKLDFDTIDIYNAVGQRVWSGIFRQAVDVSAMPTGEYRILINGVIIKPFVKI